MYSSQLAGSLSKVHDLSGRRAGVGVAQQWHSKCKIN